MAACGQWETSESTPRNVRLPPVLPDEETVSREGRSMRPRQEIGGALAVRLKSRPDKPRRSSYSVSKTTEMDSSSQIGYHLFGQWKVLSENCRFTLMARKMTGPRNYIFTPLKKVS